MISSKVIVVGMLEGTYLHIPFHVCLKLSIICVTKKIKPPSSPAKNTKTPKTKAQNSSKLTNKTNNKPPKPLDGREP